MAKNGKIIISEMYCTKCGNRGIDIPRRNGYYREAGHLKELFCVHCQKVVNHVEVRPFFSDYNLDDFKLEMEYHNFNENGERITPYRIFRGELKKKGVI